MKKRLFLNLIDSFIHEDVKQPSREVASSEVLRKSRLIVGFSAATAPLVLIMFVVRYIAEQGAGSKTIFVLPLVAMLLLTNIFLVKRFKNYTIGTIVTLVAVFIVVPLRAYMTGGMSSAVITWYCIIPVWCGMMIGGRAAIVSAIIAAAQLLFLSYPDLLGLHVPQLTLFPMAQYVVATICIFCIAALIVIYENQRLRYNEKLLNQSIGIEAERRQTESLNQLLEMMLNSVGQGFLMFDHNGDCRGTYSKACESLLESSPRGKKIWDVLKINNSGLGTFNDWLKLIFKNKYDFLSFRGLGPQSLINSKQQYIRLEYFSVLQNSAVQSVVMVATDISAEIQAKEQATRDRDHARMIIKMASNNYAFTRFSRSFDLMIEEFCSGLDNFEQVSDKLFRTMHTIKGTARTMSMMDMANLCHSVENTMRQFSLASQDDQVWMRLEIESLLEKMKSVFKEARTEFETIIGSQHLKGRHVRRLADDQIRLFYKILTDEKVSAQLQDQYSNFFIKEPVNNFFHLYEEMLEDVAEQRSKQVKPLQILGGDLLIDPEPYMPLFESFVHIFRNCVDHGLELPAVRRESGKDPAGQIRVQFSMQKSADSNWLRIEISDDGGGVDTEKIRAKLQELGRASDADGKSTEELLQVVFSPNFTTSATVTDISGRGVGLDAVMTEAKKLGGRARIESTSGQGSRIVIEVPELTARALNSRVA